MAFRYEELEVCKDIRILIRDVYKLSADFPSDERYGLTSQLRRASTSVLLNIAEGSARRTPKEFAKFITYSLGSLMECHAAINIACDLGYLADAARVDLDPKILILWKRLCALRTSQQT